MTEEEAKRRWCPMGHRATRMFFAGKADGQCACVASACMAWRWTGKTNGYCGLERDDALELLALARRGAGPGRQKAAAEIERLRVENIQMKFALGYPMPADLERHILPANPFKCGTCDARAALTAQPAAPGERRTGLRLVMVAATLLDQEDLPDEPSAILCGSIDAIRSLGGLLGDPVDVLPAQSAVPGGDND